MYVLHIEHPVPNYEGWKRAFDSDPMGRAQAGVRRHRVLRAVDEPNYVVIDLEFDTAAQAEALLTRLRGLWDRVAGEVMTDPQARIVEIVEQRDY